MAETTVPPLPRGPVVDKQGMPMPAFLGWLREVFNRIGRERAPSNTDLSASIASSGSTFQGQISALDGRVGALEAWSAPLPSYTVATLPSAAANARRTIYVSNESGGAVPAFSDGANWRRVTDRAVVS